MAACVCTALQAAAQQHPSNEEVLLNVFEAAAVVAEHASAAVEEFARLGFVADVVAALRRRTASIDIQEAACHALHNLLACSTEDLVEAEAGEAGAADAVCQLLGRCQADAHDWLYHAVLELCYDGHLAAALCGAGAVERGIVLLRQAQRAPTRNALVVMLIGLCDWPGARVRAGRAGVVEVIATLLQDVCGAAHVDIQRHLYYLLEQLITTAENLPRVADARLHRRQFKIATAGDSGRCCRSSGVARARAERRGRAHRGSLRCLARRAAGSNGQH